MLFTFIANKLGGFNGFLRNKFPVQSITRFVHKRFSYETNPSVPLDLNVIGSINLLHNTYGIFISGHSVIGKKMYYFSAGNYWL